MNSFEDVEPLQIEDQSVAPVAKPDDPEKDRRWLVGFLNLLASDTEADRAAAAVKIKAMADRKKMLVADMVVALLAPAARREAPPARESHATDAAAYYTASGVPRHERKHKAPDHNLSRLREAYAEFGAQCDLFPEDRTMIEDVLRIKQYDWELSDRVRRFVRDMTKKLLASGEQPLA